MEHARSHPPVVVKGRRLWDTSRSRRTLEKYYAAKRKLYAEDFPDIYDADLRAIFEKGEPGDESAAQVMRRLRNVAHRRRRALDRPAQVHRQRTRQEAGFPMRRTRSACPARPTKLLIELASYLAALVTNHLHTGRFKRSY